MTAILKGCDDVIAKLTPSGDHRLAHLSDEELLANTRRLVGKSNQLLAALLAHLAEVEARGIHRTRRCASLYTYCIYELRFSEDAAARRSAAARLVKQFPVLFDAIANGELHLTGLLMIGPHLTSENHVAVLGRAKFRTKKELGKLVRDLNPLPQVPDRIEPLGPEPLRSARNPTWEQYVTSLAPPVRELPLGERPRDWATQVGVANEVDGGILGAGVRDVEETTGVWGIEGAADAADVQGVAEVADAAPAESVARVSEEQETTGGRLPVGPVPRDLPPVTGPQHYQVQFSTVEEHAQLVERARGLLARTRPRVTLGELHLEAMRIFVASLEKRTFAVPGRFRRASAKPSLEVDVGGGDNEATAPRRRGDDDGSDTTSGKSHEGKHGREHNTSAMPRQRVVGSGRGVGDGSDSASDTTASNWDDGRHGHDQNAITTPRQRGIDNGSDTTPRRRGDDDETDTTHGKTTTKNEDTTGTPPRRRANAVTTLRVVTTAKSTTKKTRARPERHRDVAPARRSSRHSVTQSRQRRGRDTAPARR